MDNESGINIQIIDSVSLDQMSMFQSDHTQSNTADLENYCQDLLSKIETEKESILEKVKYLTQNFVPVSLLISVE